MTLYTTDLILLKPGILFLMILCFVSSTPSHARILHIGTGHTFTSPNAIQANAKAGDTILIHSGTYTGTFFIENINGTAASPILIQAATGENVVFSGGTESFHFSDVSYIELKGLIMERQTGNGMNIDDAGTFATPSHHVYIRNCTFRNMNASGNNDMLKLSGLDDFIVEDCVFLNGATGGSGIDMVGCHRGAFRRIQFTNLGSNSIQAKGGTQDIIISQCLFKSGGARAINIGGSTGLEFFRPLNAKFEASRVMVYANVFEGGDTPFAFVGAVDCKVVHNTIIRPLRWAMRILQETVDPSRFEPSGRNEVINNLFILGSVVNTDVNIGPDTAPQTFIFSNNCWYKEGNVSWRGPVLPVTETNQVIADPKINVTTYKINTTSPAYKKGKKLEQPIQDYYHINFANPPSIGAAEAEGTTAVQIEIPRTVKIEVYPNPVSDVLYIKLEQAGIYSIHSLKGVQLGAGRLMPGINEILLGGWASGTYMLGMTTKEGEVWKKLIRL